MQCSKTLAWNIIPDDIKVNLKKNGKQLVHLDYIYIVQMGRHIKMVHPQEEQLQLVLYQDYVI